jgi:hypothetical protein
MGIILDYAHPLHRLNNERQTLRQTADALPLLSTLKTDAVNEEQHTRLTRRALSHLGDLPEIKVSCHCLYRAQACVRGGRSPTTPYLRSVQVSNFLVNFGIASP